MRTHVDRMGLGGISGKRFEQEVIDVVREAARALYVNRSGNICYSVQIQLTKCASGR
jgi:hypothetical protein